MEHPVGRVEQSRAVSDEEDHSLASLLADGLSHDADAVRVEVRIGLVEHEQGRLAEEDARDRDTLPLTRRERVDRDVERASSGDPASGGEHREESQALEPLFDGRIAGIRREQTDGLAYADSLGEEGALNEVGDLRA